MRSSVLGFLILVVLAIPSSAQVTTYTYTGDPYTFATAPYSVGGQLTGTFTTASPLPAFLPLTDISGSLQSFSFSDGIATRTNANSFVCSFQVATDGAGNVTRWNVFLRESPYTTGNPQHSIESNGQPGPIQGADQAGTGPAGPGPCDPFVLTANGGTGTQGSWTDTFNMPSTPTTYTYTGDPYTTAGAPYSVGGNLTGTITTANPLPPFLPLTDITPAITSLSFNDDVQTRTLANSIVCSFLVATDGAGNITRWQITLREFPYTTGNPQQSIDSSGVPGILDGSDLVGTGNAGPGPCDPFALTTSASTGSEGTWTDNNPLGTQPTTYTYTGDPYTAAGAPYTLSDRLTGTITTANPLPPFMPLTDITPAITSLSFNDGVATRTLANSFLCEVRVATDGAGTITRWVIALRESPYTTGNPQHSINSTGMPTQPEGADVVGTGPANANPCGLVLLSESATTGSQGTWTDTNPLTLQPTIYTYTGDPFTSALPPYNVGGQVTGTITTANPLPPFLALTDITTAITSLTFTDGIQTRTLGNSFVCTFQVATDGAGNITEWVILLRQSPFSPGDPQQSIDSSGNAGLPEGNDLAGTGPGGAGPCSPIALTAFGSTGTQGTWIGAAAIGQQVPALDGWGLLMLTALLGGIALLVLRR
jgi:IPTL-CTERM motif